MIRQRLRLAVSTFTEIISCQYELQPFQSIVSVRARDPIEEGIKLIEQKIEEREDPCEINYSLVGLLRKLKLKIGKKGAFLNYKDKDAAQKQLWKDNIYVNED